MQTPMGDCRTKLGCRAERRADCGILILCKPDVSGWVAAERGSCGRAEVMPFKNNVLEDFPSVKKRDSRPYSKTASMAIPGSCWSSTPRIQTMRPSSSRTGQRALLVPVTLKRSSTSFTFRGPLE